MEVSYKRHFNKSYMILMGEAEPTEVLELSILAYNRIPGLLPVETEIADGEIRFWYDITGKQTLIDYLKNKKVDFPLLKLLFETLEKVCFEMPIYLLDEEFLMLEAEYLYLDFERSHLEFVYLPGRRRDIRDSFRELMEFLLGQLDHNDKKAVAVAYEMYQLSLQREKSLPDMLKQALDAGDMKEQVPSSYEPEAWTEKPGEMENIKERTEEKEKSGKNEWLREKQKAKDEYKPDQNSFMEMTKKELGWLKQKFYPKEKHPSENSDFIREEETVYHPTEILNENSTEQGILMYQGEGRQKDMKIDKPVFIIGKKENEVDGYIGTKTVSRVHACIEISEGNYYLEDMNSTNGTYLNGERLEYRQKVRLKARDRITFGIEEYVFV